MSIDVCVPYWDPLPVLHFKRDLSSISPVRPSKFQEIDRFLLGGIREEDLVVFLDYLLASAYLDGHEVATYSPVILACRRLG